MYGLHLLNLNGTSAVVSSNSGTGNNPWHFWTFQLDLVVLRDKFWSTMHSCRWYFYKWLWMYSWLFSPTLKECKNLTCRFEMCERWPESFRILNGFVHSRDLGLRHQHHPFPNDSRLCCCMGDLIISNGWRRKMRFHGDKIIFHQLICLI